MNKLIFSTAFVAAALFTPSPAYAVTGTILKPMSATANVDDFSTTDLSNLFNEIGLMGGYATISNAYVRIHN